MTRRDRIDLGLERWGRLMVRRRWLVLVLALFFLVCMASFLPHMRVENASQSYLHDDNPASIRYEAFCDQFGQDDQIVVAITPPDVFTQIALAIPFIVLFEISLLISWLIQRK